MVAANMLPNGLAENIPHPSVVILAAAMAVAGAENGANAGNQTPPQQNGGGGEGLPPEEPTDATLSQFYRVVSQTVRISCVDFAQQAFRVHTEISLVALNPQMVPIVVLRLGKGCILPNEPGFDLLPPSGEDELDETGNSTFGFVTVNNSPANYYRNQFTLPLSEDHPEKTLAEVQAAFGEVLREYPGDLIIEVPDEFVSNFLHHSVVRVTVDVLVRKPKKGVRFALSSRTLKRLASAATNQSDASTSNAIAAAANGNENGATAMEVDGEVKGEKPPPKSTSSNSSQNPVDDHLFTYLSGHESSTREWLPCIDAPDQLALWRFEFSLRKHLTAVCCGDLMDTIPSLGNEEMRTFHYQLLVPTSAAHIGFAVGPFDVHIHPESNVLIGFTLPQLTPLLKQTLAPLNRVFSFFEELLASPFPFGSLRLLFLDEVPADITSYAGLTLLPLSLLYHKKVLDPVQNTRQKLAMAIAHQFFGCFMSAAKFVDRWLLRGLAAYISGLYVERTFGTSEYLLQLKLAMTAVCDYERLFGPLIPAPRDFPSSAMTHQILDEDPMISGDQHPNAALNYYDPRHPETVSPHYLEVVAKKAHLLMRQLERRVGPRDQFLKVLQQIIKVAWQNAQDLEHPGIWPQHQLLSPDALFQMIRTMTLKEFPTFVEQCVHGGGHLQLRVQHSFNRKRNVVELEIRQEDPPPRGRIVYVGALSILVQELEGAFPHVVNIGQDRDRTVTRVDLPCHTKGKRPKKKRVQLANGNETEVDVAEGMDSPVLWVRVDPDQTLFLNCQITQHVQQWEYALRYERDVIGQFQAVEQLKNHASPQVKDLLKDIVQNDKLYYRVRRDAAFCLVDVCNRLPETMFVSETTGKPEHPLVLYFQRQYCCKTAPELPLPNNFVVTSARLQEYFLAQSLVAAIAGIRVQSGKECPPHVPQLLLNLLRYNDNTVNRYSDDFYRASLISALTRSVVPGGGDSPGALRDPESMSPIASAVLKEVVLRLNMDVMKPSFGRIIAQQCLASLVHLQQKGHIPQDTSLFWKFGQSHSVYTPLREKAFACLVQLSHRNRNPAFAETVLQLLQDVLLGEEESPAIRYALAQHLCVKPPFAAGIDPQQSRIYPANTARLANSLWAAIINPDTEERLRGYLMDLWWTLYGPGTPVVCAGIGAREAEEEVGDGGGRPYSSTSMH